MAPRKKRPVFRSGLEQRIANDLERRRIAYEYETLKITYIKEPSTYTPDFILPNGIIIEAKGRLYQADRVKMKLVQAQHPEYDIRFVFEKANKTISKRSKTTYAQWADRHGFPWAEALVPTEWLREPRNTKGKR